jgi:hypothetical protein
MRKPLALILFCLLSSIVTLATPQEPHLGRGTNSSGGDKKRPPPQGQALFIEGHSLDDGQDKNEALFEPIARYRGGDEAGELCYLHLLDYLIDEGTGEEVGAWVRVNYSEGTYQLYYSKKDRNYDYSKMCGWVGSTESLRQVCLYYGPLHHPEQFTYFDNTGEYAENPVFRTCVFSPDLIFR